MRMSATALTAIIAALGCLAADASAGARAQTEHFEVVSTLGPEIVGPAAEWLEQTRRRFLDLGLSLRERGPVTAILTPTIVEMAPYVASHFGRTRGLSLVSPDRNYIVVAWDAPGDPFEALAHEYAHLVDRNPDNPVWFREGLADYLSLLRPAEGGRLQPHDPIERLEALRRGQWLPLEQLLTAQRGSPEFAQPLYYSQAWLTVRWMASRQPDLQRLDPDSVASLSSEEAEKLLRAFLDTLRGKPEAIVPPAAAAHIAVSAAVASETAYWLADLDRFVQPRRAREALERLSEQRPNWLPPVASLGALAMAEGRYDDAETLLAQAVRDPDATAATHHHYAQMLLRPVDDDPAIRGEIAAIHAALALEAAPRDPRFLLTHAQALMVARRWETAAGALRALLADPEWRERAEREFAEIGRRRWQAMRAVEAPRIVAAAPLALDHSLAPPALAEVSPPPVQAKAPDLDWPPPGTMVISGRIDRVDCAGPDKLIILRHPLLRIQFREPKRQPARLFFPPEKSWKSIPCGARGWTINLAYKPSRAGSDVRGDVVAILF
jgi:tetratricopeptide (TPR) repeat protein